MSYLENCGEILNFWPVWRRKPNDRLFRGMTFIIFANSIYMRIKSRYCVTLTYLIWRQRRINHISHNATLPTILSSWREQVISSFRMDEPRRACRWPPMFSNRRCHTYIPGQRVHFWGQIVWLVFPSAEMFVWTRLLVCPDLFRSGEMMWRKLPIETFSTPSEGWNSGYFKSNFVLTDNNTVLFMFTQPRSQGVLKQDEGWLN